MAAATVTTTTTTTTSATTHGPQTGCCANFGDFFNKYIKQLTGCISDHGADEKVGLLWFKFAHKGCGSFANAHHAFLCWLTLTVWAQAILGIFYFIFLVILPLEICINIGTQEVCVDADYDMGNAIVTILIQFFWAFLWCYVGYWAMETKNKIWTAIFLLVLMFWDVVVVLNLLETFDLWDFNILFIFISIGYFILCAAAIHTLVFGVVTFLKLNPDIEAKLHTQPAAATTGTATVKTANTEEVTVTIDPNKPSAP